METKHRWLQSEAELVQIRSRAKANSFQKIHIEASLKQQLITYLSHTDKNNMAKFLKCSWNCFMHFLLQTEKTHNKPEFPFEGETK